MVVPLHLVPAVEKIQDTILICPTLISQYAAVGALSAGRAYCEERLRTLAEVRSMVLDELGSISEYCDVPRVEGAFYLLLRVRTRLDALSLVERLIREHGVALIPGTAFAGPGCKKDAHFAWRTARSKKRPWQQVSDVLSGYKGHCRRLRIMRVIGCQIDIAGRIRPSHRRVQRQLRHLNSTEPVAGAWWFLQRCFRPASV
jgi:aspartate/methionine/tyrosine aminotransferase